MQTSGVEYVRHVVFDQLVHENGEIGLFQHTSDSRLQTSASLLLSNLLK